MRVLVTGGAGFIGSHLSEKLLRLGNEVSVLDDLSTGSLANIRQLIENSEFADRFFLTTDSILNRETLSRLIGSCDAVMHLAAVVGVLNILKDPLGVIETNIRGTENVLELSAKFGRKILITSSSEVYGKHSHAPLVETDDCIYGPSSKFRWSYAATKLIDEFAALSYYRTVELQVVVARLFNTIGPRQTGRYGMVVPRFIKQAIIGEPITIYGDGKQTRTFTHVRNVVDALIELLESAEGIGQVVNIGGEEEISILQLAEKIKFMLGSQSELQFVPYEEAFAEDFEDMMRRVPSVEKLRSIIGTWEPAGLDEMLRDAIDYYTAEFSSEKS